MATNNWRYEDHVTTDDFDIYSRPGETTTPRPGYTDIREDGTVIEDPVFFPLSTINKNSLMDQDPDNTGPTNDFWTDYPISIDKTGAIFYHGENTGINVRGPEGAPRYVQFDSLTEEEKASLKGADGKNGVDGRNGADGQNGADGLTAYEEWRLTHPTGTLEDFYAYIASFVGYFIKEGTGNGSLILNYKGLRNTASGEGATASGNYTEASGANSFAAGDHTTAAYANQFVAGQYNENKSTNIFEVGNGAYADPSNALEVTADGDLNVQGEVKDGLNNRLSNKVDKIQGKQLSTNDFTNEYKNFIDHYTVDESLSPSSVNPVENKAIYQAINSIVQENQKPTVINTNTQNKVYPFLFLEETEPSTTDLTDKLAIAKYDVNFTWEPVKKILSTSTTNSAIANTNNILLYGSNLTNAESEQFIIGYNNSPNALHIFQIGNGNSAQSRSNAMVVTRTGDIIAGNDVKNAAGDVLGNKQDILSFDEVPTEDSDAVITSGDLYTFFVNNNYDEDKGFYPPILDTVIDEIDDMSTTIINMQADITQLQTDVLHELTDDTTGQVYIFGINNGEFYIQPKPSENNEEEEEENE